MEQHELEYRVSYDGTTQFMPRLFSRGGFAYIPGYTVPSSKNALRSRQRQKSCVAPGILNVLSLLDMEGSIRTARQGCEVHVDTENKRIHQVVRALG